MRNATYIYLGQSQLLNFGRVKLKKNNDLEGQKLRKKKKMHKNYLIFFRFFFGKTFGLWGSIPICTLEYTFGRGSVAVEINIGFWINGNFDCRICT